MTTTTKLAGIALTALTGLALYWGVTHLAKLIIILAIAATVTVVAGPAIKSAKTKLERKQVTSADEVDWDAAVRAYKLPHERKGA